MEPNQSGQLGTMINTQPSPQALPDANVASLVPSPSVNADQAKATLGNATYLQSLLLPPKGKEKGSPVEGSQKPSDVPQATQDQKKEESTETGLETRLTKQIDELKGQITNNHQLDEISRIRQELTDLLKDDGQAGKN